MRKAVKGLAAVALAAAVSVTAVFVAPKSVKAAELDYGSVLKLAVYEAMNAGTGSHLAADFRENDYNSAAKWLLQVVEETNQQYGFDVSTSKVLKPLKQRLAELQEKEYLQAGKSGNLAELSKAYVVNAVSDSVTEDLAEMPEVSKDLYEFVAADSVSTDGVSTKLSEFLAQHPDAVNSDAQIDALNTIVLSMQYNVGTDAEREIKRQQKQYELEAMQKLAEGCGTAGAVVDPSYVEKFYAVNQIQTYMDVAYGKAGGSAADSADTDSTGDAAAAYEDVSAAYDLLKTELTRATADSAVKSDVDIVSQMNEIQELLQGYIVTLDNLYQLGMYDQSQAAGLYADVQSSYNDALVASSVDQGVQAYQLAVSAEEISAVKSELSETKDSLSDARNDVKSLKSQYSLLSMRTTSEIKRIYNSVDSLDNATYGLQSNLTTLTLKTKTDLDALQVQTEKADLQVKMEADEATAELDAKTTKAVSDLDAKTAKAVSDLDDKTTKANEAMSGRVNVLESQTFTTTITGLRIRRSNWISSGNGRYYYLIENPAITVDCLIQISYNDDPPINPVYTIPRDGQLMIDSGDGCGNPEVVIDSLVIYSKKHA